MKGLAPNLARPKAATTPGVPSRAEALAVLPRFERVVFRIVDRMNRGAWKALWAAIGRQVHARVLHGLVRRRLHVFGIDHVARTDGGRPVLLVANHRSFYDLFLVSAILLRRLPRRTRVFFPVRGRYYYESPGGVLLNWIAAMWSMYPPLYAAPSQRAFNRYSLDLLIRLCRSGRGHLVGIHPEGGRNRDPDPYSFRRIQPGAGHIIHAAQPQVVPVFVAGLSNRFSRLVAAAWHPEDRIRVHFGPAVDLSELYAMPAKGSTYKRITEHVMARVRDLAEHDRAQFAGRL
jgi:1-acyl-sn-glycerol-3-phosphate acyltransferase